MDTAPEPARRCPRCGDSPLADYLADSGVTVDFCRCCQGIWCDRDELEELVDQPLDPSVLPLPFGEVDESGPRCPACREARLTGRQTGSDPPLELLDCRSCGGVWLDGGVLPQLRRALQHRARERPRSTTWRPGLAAPELAAEASRTDSASPPSGPAAGWRYDDRLPYDVPMVNAWALPVAFLIAILCNLTAVKILLYPFQILVHELGHAVTAWLSGRLAVPLPMGVTFWSGRSTLVGLIVLGGLVALGYLGWRERRWVFLAAVAILALLQLYLTWGTDAVRSEMWVTFGGIGGELVISAFLVAAFYYRAPDRLRWDFWRYILLVPCACAFTLQVILWQRVRGDMSLMPIGSALAGTRDGSGDLEKLMNLHGWTREGILAAYDRIAFVCAVVLFGHYLYFSVVSVLRRRR